MGGPRSSHSEAIAILDEMLIERGPPTTAEDAAQRRGNWVRGPFSLAHASIGAEHGIGGPTREAFQSRHGRRAPRFRAVSRNARDKWNAMSADRILPARRAQEN